MGHNKIKFLVRLPFVSLAMNICVEEQNHKLSPFEDTSPPACIAVAVLRRKISTQVKRHLRGST